MALEAAYRMMNVVRRIEKQDLTLRVGIASGPLIGMLLSPSSIRNVLTLICSWSNWNYEMGIALSPSFMYCNLT